MISFAPISRNAARDYLSRVHRHLSPPPGWVFGVALHAEGAIIGVACAARPARMLQDGFTLEIKRVATEGYPNACSASYGALRRAAVALGYRRIYTYIRMDEPGSSVRAAGFVFDRVTDGGEWSRPSRKRRKAEDPERKQRYVWPATQRVCAGENCQHEAGAHGTELGVCQFCECNRWRGHVAPVYERLITGGKS